MTSRRVLVTGLSTYWGGRLAQALEKQPEIEVIVGVDSEDPTRELERTEFVRVGTQHALLRRIVEAAEIDTVIDTRLVVDSVTTSAAKAHENNVIGTMNILAACSGPSSSVRKFVFKSSAHYYGAEQDDPAFFTESMRRPHPPRTRIERDIVDAEGAVSDFAEQQEDVSVSVMRFANVLGPDVRTSHTTLFSLPAVPTIFGFDPRYQFVHEDDVVGALEHVVAQELPGVFNVAADGVLALTEVVDLLGKRWVPAIPPFGSGLAATVFSRMGLRIPPEMLSQMRFGRGLDNRKLKASGFAYRYTTREAVLKMGEQMRLDPILRGIREPYRYEREVEEFLRRSSTVRSGEGRELGLTTEQIAELKRLLRSDPEFAVRERELDRAAPAPQAPAAERERTAFAAQEPAEAIEPRVEDEAELAPGTGGDAEAALEAEAEFEARTDGEAAPPLEDYDDLEAEEVISLLGSLEREDLVTLLDYERGARGRPTVVSAIESVLDRRTAAPRG